VIASYFRHPSFKAGIFRLRRLHFCLISSQMRYLTFLPFLPAFVEQNSFLFVVWNEWPLAPPRFRSDLYTGAIRNGDEYGRPLGKHRSP
jgi:hypothetical protein